MLEMTAGGMVGVLVGLALRPLLDAYVIHRMQREAERDRERPDEVWSIAELLEHPDVETPRG